MKIRKLKSDYFISVDEIKNLKKFIKELKNGEKGTEIYKAIKNYIRAFNGCYSCSKYKHNKYPRKNIGGRIKARIGQKDGKVFYKNYFD